MKIVYSANLISLDPLRSALLDVKSRTLLFTLERLLSGFDIELQTILILLLNEKIKFRQDPANQVPCLAFDDIPRLLSLIRPIRQNEGYSRRIMEMHLDFASLRIRLNKTKLLDQPSALSDELTAVFRWRGLGMGTSRGYYAYSE